MRPDNWGWRARFGILVIDKDPVAEAEFWALAPAGVTVHAGRFASPRPPGTDSYTDTARIVAESADIARGLSFLGGMKLSAICVCFVTSSFFGGTGFDETFTAQAARTAHGTPVTTTARSIARALHALDVHRPYVVVPPWFKDEIITAATAYFASLGAAPARIDRFDPGGRWREMQPWQIWDAGGQFEIRPDDVRQQVRRDVPADADAVVIAGSGFRAIDVIEPLEAELGLPVLTSNQTGIWDCLRLAGVAPDVTGAGRLFAA